MKMLRQVCAAPFFGVGLVFMCLAGLILGDQNVEWMDAAAPTHH